MPRTAIKFTAPLPETIAGLWSLCALTADSAVRLARYFAWPAEVWLNLQANHDRQLAEDTNKTILARIRPPA